MTAGYVTASPVFDGLSVDLTGPGLVGLRGANGTGKSTFLELCSGYLRPMGGYVLVDGEPAHSPRARASRRVCRSSAALLPEMSARDHLVLAARSSGTDLAQAIGRADRFGLQPWLGARARTLSNGNRRKLWMLMCTPGNFRHVWLDEPFQGMDEEGVCALIDEIGHWRRTSLVILIAHDWPEQLVPDLECVLDPVEGVAS
ncbi:ABC transporter ATP-binding protein [Nocardioides sp.]|uniref:ABC transporter ATP-binding protein n=1 Tax=Nocardioides sp. TaxID=35761 RepID=UPI003D0D5E3C